MAVLNGVKKATLAGLALFLAAGSASGLGLRTKFGEVVVKNVYIGQSYSLYKLVNLPLGVTNTSDEPIDVRMSVLKPGDKSLRGGYEAIPSTGWTRLDSELHLGVLPGAEAISDVLISIPDDRELLGRRFQVHFWSRMINRQGVAAGLESLLLIHVASEPLGELDALRLKVSTRVANANFMLMPSNGAAAAVPLGERVDLKERYGLSIKLVNPNDQKVTFRLVPKNWYEAAVNPIEGYDMPPNPRWLKFENELLEVPPNSIGEAKMFLELPANETFRGAKWLFVAAADVLEQDVPVHYNYRLLVTVADKPRPDATKDEEAESEVRK